MISTIDEFTQLHKIPYQYSVNMHAYSHIFITWCPTSMHVAKGNVFVKSSRQTIPAKKTLLQEYFLDNFLS
jgi:hypothetical protein